MHPHPTLGMGSIGQKSTFSVHDNGAYLIKGNHEMQQRGRNMVEIVQISIFLLNNHRKLVDRLLIMICMIPKVNLGVDQMGLMFCDL